MAYLKPKKGVKGTVKIPDSITVNHVTYKVTEIAANAFKNQKKIRKVVIPSGVSKIGEKAFYGCKNLKNITIKTTKLTKKRVGSKAIFRHPCESSHQSAEEKTFCLQEDAQSTRSRKKGKRTGDQGKT